MNKNIKYLSIYNLLPVGYEEHFRRDGSIKSNAPNALKLTWNILRFKQVHQDKYDYSKVVGYPGSQEKIEVICPEHGGFSITMCRHLKDGCPRCGRKKVFCTEDFINSAKATHDNYYDYSLVEYTTTDVPVSIVCPIHGTFSQAPHYHLSGSGCPSCVGSSSDHLYVLTYQDYIKVGISSNPLRRIQELRNKHNIPWHTYSLFKVEPSAKALEKVILSNFSAKYQSDLIEEGYTETFFNRDGLLQQIMQLVYSDRAAKEVPLNG